MQTLMIVATSLGFILSLLVSAYCVKKYLPIIAIKFSKNKHEKKVVEKSGYILSAISIFPALFLGFVVGGNLGGSYGAIAFETIGLGKAGIPIGLAFGLILVTVTIVQVIMLIGAGIGLLIFRGFVNE